MEGLDAEGGIAYLLLLAPEEAIGGQQQGGADALASQPQRVVDGLVELVGLGDESLLLEDFRHLVEIIFYIIIH